MDEVDQVFLFQRTRGSGRGEVTSFLPLPVCFQSLVRVNLSHSVVGEPPKNLSARPRALICHILTRRPLRFQYLSEIGVLTPRL